MVHRIMPKHQLLQKDNLPPDVTRQEREYIELLSEEHEDPSKQHHIIVEVLTEKGYEPMRLYEPTMEDMKTILSELLPIWQRSKVSPFCTCDLEYQRALNAIRVIEAAVCTFTLTGESLRLLKEQDVPVTIRKALKPIQGQTFFSYQDSADALQLQGVLTYDQAIEYGDQIMGVLAETGIDEKYKQKRLAALQTALDKFHGNVPDKPMHPTFDPCPYCHRHYQYGFLDILTHETHALTRIKTILLGDFPLAISSMPRVLHAMESWVFTHDSDLFVKKNTMTANLMETLKLWYSSGMTIMRNMLGDSSSKMDESTGTVSASSAATSPPPPPNIQEDN